MCLSLNVPRQTRGHTFSASARLSLDTGFRGAAEQLEGENDAGAMQTRKQVIPRYQARGTFRVKKLVGNRVPTTRNITLLTHGGEG
jgi:hypothetical protein